MIYLHLRDRWKLWRWRVAGHPVSERSCRRCGYPVRALEGSVCPECGADRNRVGTIAPLPPLRTDRRVIIAGWLLVVLAFAWLFDPLVYQGMPRELTYVEDCALKPRSLLYGPIRLRRTGVSAGWRSLGPYARQVESIATFAIPPNAFPGYLKELPTAIEAYRRPGGSHAFRHLNVRPVNSMWQLQGPLNREFVVEWLREIKVDVDRPDVQNEVGELARLMMSDKFGTGVYTGMQNFDVVVAPAWKCGEVRDDLAAWIRPAFWAAIALFGSVFILRYRSPKSAAAEQNASQRFSV